jgi:peptide/nickel transport system permease protein
MAGRLARFAILMGALIILNFVIPRLLPGSPIGGGGDDAVVLPAAASAALRETYRLDAPLPAQFVHYLAGLFRGDLGWSVASHRPVAALIRERLPWSLFLAGGAVLTAAFLGGWLGALIAWHPRRAGTRLLGVAAVGAGALPEFLVAMLLIVVFAARLRLLPAGGAVTAFGDTGGPGTRLLDVARHAVLPMATLVVALVPAFALLIKTTLTQVLRQPYLVTARAKGLPPRWIAWHALRNALPPAATLIGVRLGAAVAGVAVIERIFAYPGMGGLMFEAVSARDYPVMQGVFLITSAAVLAMNATLDLVAVRLDPREGG